MPHSDFFSFLFLDDQIFLVLNRLSVEFRSVPDFIVDLELRQRLPNEQVVQPLPHVALEVSRA